MAYVSIFFLCYAGSLLWSLWYMMNKQARVVRMMMDEGMPESEIDRFRKEMFPSTVLALLWSTFVTGSILGAGIAGIYALVT